MKKGKSAIIEKTQVYNVVILDRSGSMTTIRRAAVSGFNETLAGIKKAQEKYAGEQDHYITLLTFCGCEQRYVYDKMPVSKARAMKMEDYEPCCATPLYDAMGMTLTAMRRHVAQMDDAAVIVTIITDGEENASKEYSGRAIKELVGELREEAWSFSYIGANQDSVEVARELNIAKARDFEFDEAGMAMAMGVDMEERDGYYEKLSCCKMAERDMGDILSPKARRAKYRDLFDEKTDTSSEE